MGRSENLVRTLVGFDAAPASRERDEHCNYGGGRHWKKENVPLTLSVGRLPVRGAAGRGAIRVPGESRDPSR